MGLRDADNQPDRLAGGSRTRLGEGGSVDHSVRYSGLVARVPRRVGVRHVRKLLNDRLSGVEWRVSARSFAFAGDKRQMPRPVR